MPFLIRDADVNCYDCSCASVVLRGTHATTRVYLLSRRCGCVAGGGASAAASNTEPDSDFPSCNPDYPYYGNRWGERMARVLRRATSFGLCRRRKSNIERYSAEGHHERYADLVREIVARNPDVIVTGTNPVVRNVTAATSTIPVVAFMLEPLKAGLVTSLAQTRRQPHRNHSRCWD